MEGTCRCPLCQKVEAKSRNRPWTHPKDRRKPVALACGQHGLECAVPDFRGGTEQEDWVTVYNVLRDATKNVSLLRKLSEKKGVTTQNKLCS